MVKVVVDKGIPFTDQFHHPDVEISYSRNTAIEASEITKADAIIVRTRTKCNEKLLKTSKVKFIASATIGYDHIDIDYCREAGIKWVNAAGCNSGSVLQYVGAALCHLSNRYNRPLKNMKIGIVGVGNVGKKVELFAKAAGMVPLLNDPPRAENEDPGKFRSLKEIAEESDILTLHAPLTNSGKNKTHHLLGTEFFKRLKKKVFFINSARGEIVDTKALQEAIAGGIIEASIIDCWEHEPDISIDLLRRNLISTPHIAGYSQDGKVNGTSMSINSLMEFFKIPYKNWSPDSIPEPPSLEIDLKGIKTAEEGLKKAVLETYNIEDDHLRLVENPSGFENLRLSYPVRREFHNYRVTGIQNQQIAEVLKEAGFILGNSRF